MKTELYKIENALSIYRGYRLSTAAQMAAAEKYLKKVHNRYGTIDPLTIANLIR